LSLLCRHERDWILAQTQPVKKNGTGFFNYIGPVPSHPIAKNIPVTGSEWKLMIYLQFFKNFLAVPLFCHCCAGMSEIGF
jgi:hypothetical protein